MTRRRKDPLRIITPEERAWLERISRATSEPASHVARARALLAVADGQTYQAAAEAAGRRSKRLPSWWRASTTLASTRSCLDMAVVLPPPIPVPTVIVFSPRRAACRNAKPMAPQPGRSQPFNAPSAVRRTGCPS